MNQRKNKNFITKELFDIRPVKDGQLDLDRISNISPVVKIKHKKLIGTDSRFVGAPFFDIKKPDIYHVERKIYDTLIKKERKEFRGPVPIVFVKEKFDAPVKVSVERIKEEIANIDPYEQDGYFAKFEPGEKKKRKKKRNISLESLPFDQYRPVVNILSLKKSFFSFAVLGTAVLVIIFSARFVSQGLKIKNASFDNGQRALASLINAKNDLAGQDYERAQFEFGRAYDEFNEIIGDLDSLGKIIIDASQYVPFASKLSSGANLASAGKNISVIGAKSSEIIATLNKIKNPLSDDQETISLLQIFKSTDQNLKEIAARSQELEENLSGINLDDVPEEHREKFIQLKKELPGINDAINGYVDNSSIFSDVLGGNGPRKYLFLFQNNQEMRPTGGFIGTYGVLDIFNGRINKFFIDGIFNPDGQLKEKVIPPTPIQKISAAWSLHDSNWFPDFPVSAEKATWFYEKTGGPTVDGVIAMTPTVLQKLLEITGPIEMPEYEITIDKDNFIEQTQYEVEVNYDAQDNQPKKILSDLAPLILDRIFNTRDMAQAAKIGEILSDSLAQKHLLIYSKNYKIQKILSERGWSGEIIDTQKDYLSVINTNINGYKTDGVIDEEIFHEAQIENDGSVINTVTVRRRHNGGDTPYDWWNKVNANYLRIYVPLGSKLLETSGQTREFNPPPLDYKALGFKADAQVQLEENNMSIDEESGTRIYEDAGKTVFANWTYVSPKETMEIRYKYILPFKVFSQKKAGEVDTYSVLYQKQSGSIGSKIVSHVILPDNYKKIWQYPEEKIERLENGANGFRMEDILQTDKFVGAAFTKN